MQEVLILFDKDAARFADSQRYWFGFVDEEEHNGRIRMRFLTQSIDGLSRWLLMYGSRITVESPAVVLAQMRTHIQELQAHYFVNVAEPY